MQLHLTKWFLNQFNSYWGSGTRISERVKIEQRIFGLPYAKGILHHIQK